MPRRRGVSRPSKRYRELAKKVNSDLLYPLDEAIVILKSGAKKCKFDESFDIALKLNIDSKQADQLVRGSVSLPKGTGQSKRVVCFADGELANEAIAAGAVAAGGEDLAKKINDGWMDFDVAIAHPSTMRYVGRLGKVLGPKGLMPSPKSGTVTPDVIKAVKEFQAGKIEYRNDQFGNIHASVGKLSFSKDDLAANIKAFVEHILAARPQTVKGNFLQKISITSTMGPGLAVSIQ